MKVRTTFLLFSLVAIPLKAWSALQTMPFIAPYATPKYSQLDYLPYANVQAPKGGELTRAVIGSFDNLNSMNGRGTAVEGTNYLFDSLMSSSLDEPAVMYPLLAEKVSYDPKNFNAIIFHLNPKARFSDGSLVTAADVKFSFDIFQSKSNFGLQMYLSDLAKTEVLSKYSVKMHFKTRN
ncbi:ABC transporter substrate-binding protein, partial [Staphylococcus aureus]